MTNRRSGVRVPHTQQNIKTMLSFESTEADRIVFHYNRAHNGDPSIPMWVVKFKGKTYYVHHLESKVGFKTKETPDNPVTKGSIQFKGYLNLETYDGITTAYIREHCCKNADANCGQDC